MSQNFFWNDFTEIYHSNDVIPLKHMTFEEKMNTIGRLIIIVSILTFCYTLDINAIIGGLVAICVLIFIYNSKASKETFIPLTPSEDVPSNELNPQKLKKLMKNSFVDVTETNPLGNVLLTEIVDNPNRKAAPPSFNVQVNQNINNMTKKAVQALNPTIENVDQQLYGDSAQNAEFQHSQRNFYATANTRVANNQTAFANWLYGNMPSSKEQNPFALMKNNPMYTLF